MLKMASKFYSFWENILEVNINKASVVPIFFMKPNCFGDSSLCLLIKENILLKIIYSKILAKLDMSEIAL